MGQNKLKILAVKILANFFILAAVIAVFYFIGQAHQSPQVQAGELPKCGTSDNTCLVGVPDGYYYDNGDKCWKWVCIAGDISVSCSRCPGSCGNGVKEQGEDCDMFDLAGQTCLTQGYDGGALSCDPDCFFNVSKCTTLKCGNGVVDEPAEQCDGSNLNGKTCQSLGYDGGTLKCDPAGCNFDTSGCTRNLAICGDGIIQAGEDCDGFNLGLPPATCSSLGCGTGTLTCSANCTFNKSSCSDPSCTVSGCQNKTASDWSGFKNFTKSCCGDADGEIMDSAPSDADLCSGGGTIPTIRKIYDSQGNLTRWVWSCGQADCTAYAQAHCAGSLSEEANGSDCNPGVTFGSRAAFDAALKANGNKYCTIGSYAIGGTCGSGWNISFNKEWLCRGAAPTGKENLAHCIVGWAPDSKCGTIKDKTYTVKATEDCSQNAFFQVENKPDTPELCDSDSGSVVVPGSKKYIPDNPFNPFDKNFAGRQFTWKCWSVFGPRHGEAVPCAVNLSGTCVSQEGKCGNDANGHYAIPSNNAPGKSLCLLGQSKDLTFNSNTFTWTWVCSAGGQDTDCSVTAEAVCGGADGGDYPTEAEVRAAGPCAKGNLNANKIYDYGAQWKWTCESPADPKVYVVCRASTTKCGHAGDRAFLSGTFDSKKGNNGFLCASGTSAQGLSGPTYNDAFQRSDWNWKCNGRDCHATKLECGFGDNNAYHLINDFNTKRQVWSSFLCSGGAVAGWQETANGWGWACVGADNDTVSGCTANKYRCGDLSNQTITWTKFNELFGVNSDLGSACTGRSANWEPLCPGGAIAVCQGGDSPRWYCQTGAPDAGKFISYCSAKLLACGTAANHWYYQTVLDSNKGKDNGFLCYKGSTAGNVSYSQDSYGIVNRADWQCQGSGNEAVSCTAGVINCGYGNGRTYGDADSFYNACSKDDGNTCLCTNKNSGANPRFPSFGPEGADWGCSSISSNECHANATGGGGR